MNELLSQIKELRADFQNIASVHPWVALSVPPVERSGGRFFSGELIRLSDLKEFPNEVFSPPGARRFPSWDAMFVTLGPDGPPWVVQPSHKGMFHVAQHVDILNDAAHHLLFKVLAKKNGIARDLCDDMRHLESMRYGFGWIRWLQYSTTMLAVGTRVIENYPQVAVTALFELEKRCSPNTNAIITIPPVRGRPVEVIDNLKNLYLNLIKLYGEYATEGKRKSRSKFMASLSGRKDLVALAKIAGKELNVETLRAAIAWNHRENHERK